MPRRCSIRRANWRRGRTRTSSRAFPLCRMSPLHDVSSSLSSLNFGFTATGTGRCLPSCRCSWPTPCVGAHSTADETWRRPSPKSTASRSTSTSYAMPLLSVSLLSSSRIGSHLLVRVLMLQTHSANRRRRRRRHQPPLLRVIAAEPVGRDGGGAGEFGLRPGQRQLDPAHR